MSRIRQLAEEVAGAIRVRIDVRRRIHIACAHESEAEAIKGRLTDAELRLVTFSWPVYLIDRSG